MTLEINPLLSVSNTSDKSFENKLFNPFNFQQTMANEGNDPDLNFFNDQSEAVSLLYTLLMNFHALLIVFWKIHFLSYRLTSEVWKITGIFKCC